MTRYLVPAIPLAILLALGGFFYVGLYRSPGYIPSPFLGKPAPQFSLPDLKDPKLTVSTADLTKSPFTLFNVWGTWCVECRQEHPFLVELSKRTKIPIYGLDWKDDRKSALAWLADLGDPYTKIGFDQRGDAAINWGVYGAPETFLIDKSGTVLLKHIAPMTPEVWEQKFLPIIRSKCSALPCPLVDAE
jgi:cytochrome c biogenesis protein CcmG/thiol:disulfide interchange protein DsbE